MGQGKINRFDIVKILVHQDHYHIYDSNNREAITYTNPINLFPNAYFGEYGNKSHTQASENNSSQVKPEIKDNENKKPQVKPEIKPDENKKPQVTPEIKPDENKKPQVDPNEHNIADVKPEQDKKDDEKWPSGITKIIDHKDHWHLYSCLLYTSDAADE